MNWRLAIHLARRSLGHHRTVAMATILGIAIGMGVVGSIFIVDYNSTAERIPAGPSTLRPTASRTPADGRSSFVPWRSAAPRILRVSFERQGQQVPPPRTVLPTQEGALSQGLSSEVPPPRRGEEDYQAMRLAVRLASLMAFSVGAIIIFYTMRYSVSTRRRELSLLLCLGERRRNVALSLALEALVLGAAGTAAGLLIAFGGAQWLLAKGISTTGRVPAQVLAVPWRELAALSLLSVLIALAGVIGPVRLLLRMRVAEVLQPRFIAPGIDPRSLGNHGFGWMLPPLMAAAWLATRPFLQSWLSVVQFFLFELLFVAVLALATLWWVRPLLRGTIRLCGRLMRPLLPFETLMAEQRMRLTSRKLVFTIAGVALVFSLLTAVHDIGSSLRDEIRGWAAEALDPYAFLALRRRNLADPERLRALAKQRGLYLFRLSDKLRGELPIRLIAAADVNPYRESRGQVPLLPGTVLVSRTLAARFHVAAGDRVVVDSGEARHRFEIVDVSDEVGFYADNGQYVDLKSYLLFSDGNPLFADNLEPTLGRWATARSRHGEGKPRPHALAALSSFYRVEKWGWEQGAWQRAEIGRDFAIFDYILAMTVLLAAVGVSNTMLLQVRARARELAVLRTLGGSRLQTVRLLLVEGGIIGLVAALLALVLGNLIGMISVGFLDRFTLFDYRFVLNFQATLAISALAVLTCVAAAIYPALVANRVSSAESLHYE